MELKNRSFQVQWYKNTQVDTFSGFPNPVQLCLVTITGFLTLEKTEDFGKSSRISRRKQLFSVKHV